MSCSCQTSICAPILEITQKKIDDLKAGKSFFKGNGFESRASEEYSNEAPKVISTSLPGGKSVLASLFVNNEKKAAGFYSKLGDFQVGTSVSYKGRVASVYSVSVGPDGMKSTLEWQVDGGDPSSINPNPRIIVNPKRDATIDCLLRHAPACSTICGLPFVGIEVCIACAGVVGACCLINSNC